MVRSVEGYPYSSHRAYAGMEEAGIVDVDPVLRRFGVRREVARKHYAEFVAAGAKLGPQEQFYAENGILGSEEFVDDVIHRIGEHDTRAAALRRKAEAETKQLRADDLLRSVEAVCDVPREEFCGPSKGARQVFAKEAMVLSGRRLGGSITELSRICGLTSATVSRRYDLARRRLPAHAQLADAHNKIIEYYENLYRES